MVNMAHLKGNLGLKSSSLSPTSSKLSTQYLVLDHMTNHYNKISKAKSAIDNKPPKSIATSQKMRDRRTRQHAISPHRNRPVSSMSYTKGHMAEEDIQEYQDLLDEEPEDEEGRLVYSIMKSTLGKKSMGSNDATFNSKTQTYSHSSGTVPRQENGDMTHLANGEHQRMTWQRPMSARSSRSVTSSINGTTRVPLTSHDQKKITYNGDVLDKRSHCFTEPDRPFTPRTLKSNHQSRLKSSKCYNPPKHQNVVESSSVPEQGKERESRPRPQPRPQPRQRKRSEHSDQFGETMPTNQLSESMLMDITLQSRDGRHGQEPKRDIPPLAISVDTDHFKWLQEQASKAQVRAKHSSKLKTSLRPDSDIDGQEIIPEDKLSHSIRLETLKNLRSRLTSRSVRRTMNPWTYRMLQEEEEEQKYLAFAKEVTDDVLTRGISTDKVLNKVFENHIQRRKEDLDEDRMRAVIKDLRKDLGLRDDSVERKERHNVNFNKVEMGKSSSTFSQDQDAASVHSEIKETLSSKPEITNGTTSNSNMTMTMESTSTMQFGQTGDMFSTIHSEQQERDLSDGEVAMSGKEMDTENENELTATQVLKEYQMNLTAKEAHGDGNGEVSSSDVGNFGEDSMRPSAPDRSESSERPATGERRMDQESSTENGKTMTDSSNPTNGISTTDSFHGNQLSSQKSSTLNGSGSRSRLRNKRRERKFQSNIASDNSSVREEASSNSALKSSSAETGSEKEMSENGEIYNKPAAKPRANSGNQPKNVQANETDDKESLERDSIGMNGGKESSTGRSVGSVGGDEDYAGDYEDDYEEGSQGGETHHTSDDDF